MYCSSHSAVGRLAICLSVIINLKSLSATKVKKGKEKRKRHSSPLFWPYSHGRSQIFGWLCYFVEVEIEPHTCAIFLRRRIMYDAPFYADVHRIAYVTCVRVWPHFFFTLYRDFTQETLLRGGSSFAPAATWLTRPLSSFTPLCYVSSLLFGHVVHLSKPSHFPLQLRHCQTSRTPRAETTEDNCISCIWHDSLWTCPSYWISEYRQQQQQQ